MKDELVSFEIAELAKEKGFKEYCIDFFREEDGIIKEYSEKYDFDKSWFDLNRPTQSLLQKWLREKHGIKVIVDTDITLSWIYTIQSLHPQASYTGPYIQSINTYSTYEEALEEGLTETFKQFIHEIKSKK